MNLEGSLGAFSLPDIFQLLSFTKKSGGLHLAASAANGSPGTDGVVYFSGGSVTGASADSSRQPLARRLIGGGAVDDDALERCVGRAVSGDGVGVVKALLEDGAVAADLLQQAVSDQAVDAVFDLLRWSEADFVFVVGEANSDDVGVALTVETVLADAEARREGWESVSAVIPSPQVVLGMPILPPSDLQVSRDEWSLLALVDGRRTVTELVDLTGSGQYAVVSTLAGMVSRGLLVVRSLEEGEPATDHVSVIARRQQLLAPIEDVPFVPHAVAPDVAEVPAQPAAPDAERAEPPQPVTEPAEAAPAEPVAEPVAEPIAEQAPEAPVPPAVPVEPVTDELVTASAGTDGPSMVGGPHLPGDVVPPRPEPFLPRRQAEYAESMPSPSAVPGRSPGIGGAGGGVGSSVGEVVGATAIAADPEASAVIERDPNVNRSLMLRLIAGVRGL